MKLAVYIGIIVVLNGVRADYPYAFVRPEQKYLSRFLQPRSGVAANNKDAIGAGSNIRWYSQDEIKTQEEDRSSGLVDFDNDKQDTKTDNDSDNQKYPTLGSALPLRGQKGYSKRRKVVTKKIRPASLAAIEKMYSDDDDSFDYPLDDDYYYEDELPPPGPIRKTTPMRASLKNVPMKKQTVPDYNRRMSVSRRQGGYRSRSSQGTGVAASETAKKEYDYYDDYYDEFYSDESRRQGYGGGNW